MIKLATACRGLDSVIGMRELLFVTFLSLFLTGNLFSQTEIYPAWPAPHSGEIIILPAPTVIGQIPSGSHLPSPNFPGAPIVQSFPVLPQSNLVPGAVPNMTGGIVSNQPLPSRVAGPNGTIIYQQPPVIFQNQIQSPNPIQIPTPASTSTQPSDQSVDENRARLDAAGFSTLRLPQSFNRPVNNELDRREAQRIETLRDREELLEKRLRQDQNRVGAYQLNSGSSQSNQVKRESQNQSLRERVERRLEAELARAKIERRTVEEKRLDQQRIDRQRKREEFVKQKEKQRQQAQRQTQQTQQAQKDRERTARQAQQQAEQQRQAQQRAAQQRADQQRAAQQRAAQQRANQAAQQRAQQAQRERDRQRQMADQQRQRVREERAARRK